MHCRHPPRLPVSTGNVGIDPAGQVEVYAAPNVVRADWTHWRHWPIPPQWWWWYRYPAAWRPCGPRPSDALAWLLTSGFPGFPPPWPAAEPTEP